MGRKNGGRQVLGRNGSLDGYLFGVAKHRTLSSLDVV